MIGQWIGVAIAHPVGRVGEWECECSRLAIRLPWNKLLRGDNKEHSTHYCPTYRGLEYNVVGR